MSRFYNNKHYISSAGYQNLNINGTPPTGQNSGNDAAVLIRVIRDDTLYADTHLTSIVISPQTRDGKLVPHLVAREGSFTQYKKNVYSPGHIKLNNGNINVSGLTIKTTNFIRDTFSSKVTTASGGGGGSSAPSQIWFG